MAWSCKQGDWYVQAPAHVLSELVALRLHLDACGAQDGPLRVWPGSHRLGLLGEGGATTPTRAARREQVCTLAAGGVLALRPLLLQ